MAHNHDGEPMEQSSSEDETQRPDFAQIANAYRILANQYEGFVANPATLTPDGAVLLLEIHKMRPEMRRGFERVDERFTQIEKRGRAE